eukprot:2340064-Rhodomonas_salina.2
MNPITIADSNTNTCSIRTVPGIPILVVRFEQDSHVIFFVAAGSGVRITLLLTVTRAFLDRIEGEV